MYLLIKPLLYGLGGFRGSTLKRYGSQSALTSASKRYR